MQEKQQELQQEYALKVKQWEKIDAVEAHELFKGISLPTLSKLFKKGQTVESYISEHLTSETKKDMKERRRKARSKQRELRQREEIIKLTMKRDMSEMMQELSITTTTPASDSTTLPPRLSTSREISPSSVAAGDITTNTSYHGTRKNGEQKNNTAPDNNSTALSSISTNNNVNVNEVNHRSQNTAAALSDSSSSEDDAILAGVHRTGVNMPYHENMSPGDNRNNDQLLFMGMKYDQVPNTLSYFPSFSNLPVVAYSTSHLGIVYARTHLFIRMNIFIYSIRISTCTCSHIHQYSNLRSHAQI